ncbi:hypothetical protein A167_01691 [Alcanivorax sp. S71-1-4]|uniref:YheV family putative metal-binding protein n=1 Tax=Alcanivorax sp. S71-1-4 TaxID=1177159 RepID=UPI0013597A16|nr:YheV family putative metal-binding protein [Alcanivorax sp. S71-1-4]KAF0809620.1 hypothetical protein A167_01691 [Alcanivorax sp. S71-1-4]
MSRRRFIAGATCPECGALDKIVRVEEGDALWMECVACGMRKNLDAGPAVAEQPAEGGGSPVVWKAGK